MDVAVAVPLTVLLSWAAVGCGSDSKGVTLSVSAPTKGQVLTLGEDDSDPDTAGLQYDVVAVSTGIAADTPVRLLIDGAEQDYDASVDEKGQVRFADVTLPPGEHDIEVETSTGSVKSAEDHDYTYKALVITTPEDDAQLSMDDDDDAARGGVQISVRVTAFAIEGDESIELFVDGRSVDEETPSAAGEAVFRGVTLSNGTHRLQARTQDGELDIESAEITVEVSQSCAAVRFLTPEPPEDEDDRISLGGEGACPEGGQPFRTRIEVSTDAGEGRPVQLFVNGQPIDVATVDRAVAVFDDVVLSQGNNANSIQVDVENEQGVRCRTDFPGQVYVDCAGAGCRLTSPTAVGYLDEEEELTLYLNRSMRGEDGFEIEIETDDEIDGREVELVIDRDTRRPLKAVARTSGGSTVATFEGVDLDEGPHILQGRCTDSAGNVTLTDEFPWTVDVTACDVSITDPTDGTLFVQADDEDAVSDGTQVVVTSMVEGDDCVRQRASVCDPDDGIEDEDFAAYDSSGMLLSSITFDDEQILQSLCVEVEDRAANRASADIEVAYRSDADAPLVRIESPSDGARFNAEGGGGYEADADRDGSPTACDAEFLIACTELGANVDLHHDDAHGPVFASAECEELQDGDPVLPAGFVGRARIIGRWDEGDQAATVVATQAIVGHSASLFGASEPIELEGDCAKPAAVLQDNPCNAPSNQLGAAAAERDFRIFDNNTADIDSVEVTLTRASGASMTFAPTSVSKTVVQFTDVDFAFDGDGAVTLTGVVSDDFDNTAQVECTAMVNSDTPTIIDVSEPTDGASYRMGEGCVTGTASFGIELSATVDQVADRTASIWVNGTETLSNVAIAAGSGGTGVISNVCVPVPDNSTNGGPSTVSLRLAYAQMPTLFVQEDRTVNIVTTSPTSGTGIVIDPLSAGSPTDPDYRNGVNATWMAPMQDYPGQLVSYQMRCAYTALAAGATAMAKDTWWNGGESIALPSSLTPDDQDPEVALEFRPEEPRHCVVRAADPVDQLTPIVSSTDLTLKLRQTVLSTGSSAVSLGFKVAAVGDVDGDGIDDMLVGGLGRAELIFGTTGAPGTATKVVFNGLSASNQIGRSVTGLGDFNGDNLDDFAIGNPSANANAGQVSIFFGRPRAQWPATPIDIESACNADICLEGAASHQLGRTASTAGFFNEDVRPDFALGSAPANTVLVLLGGNYEVRSCGSCRASGESCVNNVCTRTTDPGPGQPSFWRLRYAMPSGDSLEPAAGADFRGFSLTSTNTFGISLAGLGPVDGAAGDELAIGAAVARQVHVLSGRSHDGMGMDALTTADLGLVDPTTGNPDGMPLSALDVTNYGFNLANVGDFYTPAGAVRGVNDLAVGRSLVDELHLAVGDATSANDPGFSTTPVNITASGNAGVSIATSDDPVLGLLGDLDGDGEPELCVGTRISNPKDLVLWYPDRFAAAIAGNVVTRAAAGSIVFQPTAGAMDELVVQYVGDFNDDGHLDLAVGDYRVNTSQGQVVLLY